MLALGSALLAAGCAVHYSDGRRGIEQLWGFGELRLMNAPAGKGLASVATGIRAPGLCLELGREHFGLTFGYLSRERLVVVSTNALADLELPVTVPSACSFGGENARWGFGHLRMRTVPSPSHHYAVVTGKALAGLGACWGSHDRSLGLVLQGWQRAAVLDENVRLDFDQHAPPWPGFDLFAMNVQSSAPVNLNPHRSREEP